MSWDTKQRITSAEAADLFHKHLLRMIDVQHPNPAVTIIVWTWYWASPAQVLKLYLTKMGEGRPDNAQWRLE